MLLTKASEYALLSIIYMCDKKEPIDVENLSCTLGISKSFLAKILQKLSKRGILNSYKGVRGGFSLAKEPREISILDIIQAVEDNPATVFECTGDVLNCTTGKATSCTIWPMLSRLQVKIDGFLSGITLEEIVSR